MSGMEDEYENEASSHEIVLFRTSINQDWGMDRTRLLNHLHLLPDYRIPKGGGLAGGPPDPLWRTRVPLRRIRGYSIPPCRSVTDSSLPQSGNLPWCYVCAGRESGRLSARDLSETIEGEQGPD